MVSGSEWHQLTGEMCSSVAARRDAISSLLVMRRDRNNTDPSSEDHSLPRSAILRGRKNFERLFEKSTVLNSGSVQFRYRIYSDPNEKCLIGFAAPKRKIPKAAHRNRAKRLLREAYRTRQSYLRKLFSEYSTGFHGLFLVREAGLTLKETETHVENILKQAGKRLSGELKRREQSRNRNSSNDDTK